MKKLILLSITTLLINSSFNPLSNELFSIEKEFNEIEYYDCDKTQKIEIGKDYWLGCTSAPDYMKSYIMFKNNSTEIKIHFFLQENIQAQKNKYLSTFQYPKRGFSLEDLNYISTYLKLPKPKLENGLYYIQDIYPYQMMFKEVDEKKYIMIYSITGGRMPEGIKVIKVFQVNINKKIEEKYFN
jgi:hypothetical protein